LEPSIDYSLTVSDDGLSTDITWLDGQGSTPDENEEFYVDYSLSERIRFNHPLVDVS